MSVIKIKNKRIRRALRVKRSLGLLGKGALRVSVFRSNNNISVQVIDDLKSHTIASCSSKGISAQGKKVEQAFEVGKKLAEKLQVIFAQNVDSKAQKIVFDRGQYLYHGRVKALADGMRDGGIDF